MPQFTIDIAIVVDLPPNPTQEEIVNEVNQVLTRRLAEGDLDGCLTLTLEED